MFESAWRRSGMGKDRNLFYGAFVRQPEFCNARAPGLGHEGHPSDALGASRNEPRSLRKRGKCCILPREGEEGRRWGEVRVQHLRQSPGTAPVNTTPEMPWWEHSQAAPATSCNPDVLFRLLRLTPAAVGGLVWDWAVHWSHRGRDGAEGCSSGRAQLSIPPSALAFCLVELTERANPASSRSPDKERIN